MPKKQTKSCPNNNNNNNKNQFFSNKNVDIWFLSYIFFIDGDCDFIIFLKKCVPYNNLILIFFCIPFKK